MSPLQALSNPIANPIQQLTYICIYICIYIYLFIYLSYNVCVYIYIYIRCCTRFYMLPPSGHKRPRREKDAPAFGAPPPPPPPSDIQRLGVR